MVMPKVVTELKYGKFTFRILAYRKLTEAEIDLTVREYLRTKRRKTFPKKGSVDIVTIFGAVDR